MTIRFVITRIVPCCPNPIHVVISHRNRKKEKENTRNLMEIDMHKIVE